MPVHKTVSPVVPWKTPSPFHEKREIGVCPRKSLRRRQRLEEGKGRERGRGKSFFKLKNDKLLEHVTCHRGLFWEDIP